MRASSVQKQWCLLAESYYSVAVCDCNTAKFLPATKFFLGITARLTCVLLRRLGAAMKDYRRAEFVPRDESEMIAMTSGAAEPPARCGPTGLAAPALRLAGEFLRIGTSAALLRLWMFYSATVATRLWRGEVRCWFEF